VLLLKRLIEFVPPRVFDISQRAGW
jgi:hypothetical protein